MNKNNLFTLLAVIMTLLTSSAIAKDDDSSGGFFWRNRIDIQPVNNELYKEECGSCHFAYQPGLLPQRSWKMLMTKEGLENHFKENAELAESDRTAILDYLTANAADNRTQGRSYSFINSIKTSETPLRITETRYFKRKHHEISPRTVLQNKLIGSYSACGKCHTKAERGSFNENEIKIPGYGRWDD